MPWLWWWIGVALWGLGRPPPARLWGQPHFARSARWLALPTAPVRDAALKEEFDTDQSWPVTDALEQARRQQAESSLGNSRQRCRSERRLEIDGIAARMVLCTSGHEHDGMYGDREVVLLGVDDAAGIPLALGGYVQWARTVHDSDTTVTLRRVAPLRGGGLCVETRQVEGPGLFTVLDDLPWRPRRDQRLRTAWRFGASGFVAWPEADGRCPKRGYTDLVPHAERFVDSVSRALKPR